MSRSQTEGYWVVRTYEAGKIGEKIKYFMPGEKPTRSQRKVKSDINKQKQNEYSAVKRVARLLNANFTASSDYLLTLTYSEDELESLESSAAGTVPADASEEEIRNACYDLAHHNLQLFIRRVRRTCKAAGVEFRYIAVTADQSFTTGESTRLHHHLVVNGEALQICLDKWAAGSTNHKPLEDQQDFTPLAEYLLGQVRRLPDERKYIPARSLAIPQPKDQVARGGAELRVPRGGQLLQRNEWRPGMPQYIRYVLPPEKVKTPPTKLPPTRARGGAHTRTRSSNPGDGLGLN